MKTAFFFRAILIAAIAGSFGCKELKSSQTGGEGKSGNPNKESTETSSARNTIGGGGSVVCDKTNEQCSLADMLVDAGGEDYRISEQMVREIDSIRDIFEGYGITSQEFTYVERTKSRLDQGGAT